ncbi:glycosyltransferase family 2 protein [Pelosinus sp. IPA-1]|uniref:tetratricopeptide repeat-containing glycosyltransferase family 2 protein n=1 Tax=Pelosinus sp. IPA-1 TaxID=3029569 RepID=UPI0024361EDE|nr:glycosyltransferase family 2 protein [Pelosinus sp. IPA-1]GMB00654.1 beta 1,4 glucosyltransferase [Pelosinus sp. IPA-1]
MTISLCLIVKNEEQTIARCLESVKSGVEEIIVVDTGSTDKTKAIALTFTDKVYDFKWIDNFAAARNFAFSHASQDYILWLDADDVLLKDDLQKLLFLKQNFDSRVDSYTMNYNLSFDESGNVVTSLRRNRLVKRSRNFEWIGAVHEYLEVGGFIMNSDVSVTHKKERHDTYDRNLTIYENRLSKGETFSPRDLYYYANELNDHRMYEKAAEYYQKFLDTELGWVEDNIAACGKLADCFNALGDEQNNLKFIYKSFEYDTPRAEYCCRLGYHFLSVKKYSQAIFWYKLATELEKPKQHIALLNNACWTWLPHLQLCVCYSNIGEVDLAYKHNKIAESYAPNNPSVLFNKDYFEKLLKGSS